MTAINTNVGALNARLYTLGANRAQEQAMERLSSGLRVNSAADDAAGLAVAGNCLLYTSPSPRDATLSRMPSSA